jgi:carboxyl-terminal processing protease
MIGWWRNIRMKPPKDDSGSKSLGILLILTLALGLTGGVALDQFSAGGIGLLNSATDFRLIPEAWRIILGAYVDRASAQPRTITYGAISGMVDALGDTGHSRFLSPKMVRELGDLQRNKFEGVGAEIQIRAGHVEVVAPIDSSPAQRSGLRTGDIILRVNGSEVTGLPLDQVVARISGPAGTSVALTILNPSSGRMREVILVRASIIIHNISWQWLPGTKVAHLRIAGFGKNMTVDLRRALEEINHDGLNEIILDLRNNPGGLLDEAIGAASQFLKSGDVLLTKDARGNIKPIPVRAGGIACNMPLAVLINGGTASAAEIMAGAIRDAHRAKLIGVTTIGTGTVLREFALSDGSALLLAVQEWLTPSGKIIWHKGIVPDIAVELPADRPPVCPEEERHMSFAQLQARRDAQLLYALELLSASNERIAVNRPVGRALGAEL